jgi:hypothetical protein
MHMKAVYTRGRITGLEDVAVTTHDFHAPNFDDFTDANLDAIGAAFTAYWDAINSFWSTLTTLLELRFYRGYNGDGSPGEVDHIVPVGDAGEGTTASCPPQVACSVTEILGAESRRHWGRFYLPAPTVSALALDGSY